MKRRTFLTSLGAVSATGVLAAAEPPSGVRSLPADVLIIGGGTAGTIAAIQAARLGAGTILVESGSQLGGTTTTAGVDFPGLFHAWGKQVIAGIGWELVTATAKLNDDPLPDFTQPTGSKHWKHQVRICGALYAALAEEAWPTRHCGCRLRAWRWARPRASPLPWRRGWAPRRRRWTGGISGASWPPMGRSCQRPASRPDEHFKDLPGVKFFPKK